MIFKEAPANTRGMFFQGLAFGKTENKRENFGSQNHHEAKIIPLETRRFPRLVK
jgi:hypothetical protein